MIYFGAIEPCSKCENGNFLLKNEGYVCTGYQNEWSKCDNVVKQPKRVPVKIPQAIKKKHPFLRKHFNVQDRVIKTQENKKNKQFKKEPSPTA